VLGTVMTNNQHHDLLHNQTKTVNLFKTTFIIINFSEKTPKNKQTKKNMQRKEETAGEKKSKYFSYPKKNICFVFLLVSLSILPFPRHHQFFFPCFSFSFNSL
jgi:hypothetical protein